MSSEFKVEEEPEPKNYINFSIHMHPMTQLRYPDLLDQGKNSLFQITCGILYTSLPLILCFQLNIMSSIINLYLIGNYGSDMEMAAVGLGTILANIFGFFIIDVLSVGFSVICSYFSQKEEIGFMYQKTLGITFFLCILITPLLYLNDKLLVLLGFNEGLIRLSSTYLWALIPSFYLYSFYETTKNYLQSQGVIYPCLVFGTVSAILHYLLASFMIISCNFGIMGAAWSKNICYLFTCLVLYLYIIKSQPTKDSWKEWNIKATNNVHKFLVRIFTHEILTYLQVFAFQFVGIAACYLPTSNQITAHFSLANMLLVVYFMNMGLSHCFSKSLMASIEEHNPQMCRKKLILGYVLVSITSAVITANLWVNEELFVSLFSHDPVTINQVESIFAIFLIITFISGFQLLNLGILKTLIFSKIWKLLFFSFFFVGCLVSTLLAYQFQMQLRGIWIGWLTAQIVSVLFQFRMLKRIDWDDLDEVRGNYHRQIEQINEKAHELAQYRRLS